MRIMPNRMDREFYMHQTEYEDKLLEVMRSGKYILGDNVKNFEEEFAQYLAINYCVGLASGLDALWIAFRALNIKDGDEVIVQGNTYIASVMGITINGALPVFVEPDIFFNIDVAKIEEKITKKTKAILVVHLYGQAANMLEIMNIANRYNLYVVEDCAQAHGAEFKGKKVGTFGDIGCFSFYPSKNLGAYGDGGAIVTQNEKIANYIRMYRNYGSEKRYYNKVVGANSRLDEIQAALLRIKLKYLDEINSERRKLAIRYLNKLKCPCIVLPGILKEVQPVWHQFVIQCDKRDELISYLEKKDIGTLIHYPIPPHLSEAYEYLNIKKGSLPLTELYSKTVISIPIYSGMTKEEQDYVIEAINMFL